MNKKIEFLNDAENALFERKKEAALTFLLDRLLGLEYGGVVKDRVSMQSLRSDNIEVQTYCFDKGKPTEFFIMNATVDISATPGSMVMKFGTYDAARPALLEVLAKIE